MSEKDDKLNKGSFLYIGDQDNAEWGYPKGYPYKEIEISDTLTWDGNTDGLVQVKDTLIYKMSDAVPILSDFSNGASIIITNISDLTEKEVQIPANAIVELIPGIVIIDDGKIFFISSEGVGIDIDYGLIFNEPGTYFIKSRRDFISSLTIPGYTGFTKTEVHPIAPDFLPQATQTTYGAIKKAAHVPHVTAAPTSNDFNKLLSALREAGIMRQSE